MIEKQALSVTQVNQYIKEVMNRDTVLTDILVKGELSNFKAHSSGHMYMSLKDESGVMRAVMFRSSAAKLRFKPQNGMKVVAHGRITVYERDGQYQLYIDDMQQEGIGDLYVAFEKLKNKLNAEGLFDPAHKKPLPKYPKKVGVITAPTGAAIRDIINVLSRRFSYSDVVLYPVLVQGENSAASIVEAIRYFNRTDGADVLIVGRGGGSIEDLWSFNEEIVARAIYDSHIPIVSAVGHEIDFTISDFAADLRAPTPSAAAELVVPSQNELMDKFNNVYSRLYSQANRILERAKLMLKSQAERPVLTDPRLKLNEQRIYLDRLYQDLTGACTDLFRGKQQAASLAVSRLDGLSPLGALHRGFSVTEDGNGHVIRSVKQTAPGEKISILVEDGRILAVTEKTEETTALSGVE
ncbi:exodeoxyribonuclease VII large subunit [Ructibacterium gallinarum]|uniref:Exodeoxyribonuclease 7 large subunit n=1 Tax=Ructibacterium gallinarum TaxID=2779355 RepID=A0A9D5R9K7_9FIRM|nr:exodeoxyribonuclease VII large subunit [Ructibacterium gallinarum]MBE5041127.1 exodeoxyribonuclease VII large subunit [Ructibacterium gallinarum]